MNDHTNAVRRVLRAEGRVRRRAEAATRRSAHLASSLTSDGSPSVAAAGALAGSAMPLSAILSLRPMPSLRVVRHHESGTKRREGRAYLSHSFSLAFLKKPVSWLSD
jgi:hypothetical protein